ncbi:hypothetical protein SCYAM73S_06967 [Streptomyces cyaneofuscatus]
MTQQVPQVPPTETALTGVRNFRDVGGLPTEDGRRTAFGRLYRSGHLAHATAEDALFLGGLGLHTVFDFRNSADHQLDGYDIELAGVRNVSIPLSDPADGAEFWRLVRDGNIEQLRSILANGKGTERMITMYRSTIVDRTAEHSRVLHALAEDSVPALMHCAAGKDRAGLSIAVSLLAVGVEREAIEADYLKSNDPHRRYKVKRYVRDRNAPRSDGAAEPALRCAGLLPRSGVRGHRRHVGHDRPLSVGRARRLPRDPGAAARAPPRPGLRAHRAITSRPRP